MALIAIAADKGAPGVTTSCLALAAVWPHPVLLAECDPAGGDLAAWLPAADGGRLDPGRGLLSLAAAARRGVGDEQVWEHTQKVRGGLDVLAGVITAEQGSGLGPLWGPLGRALSGLPRADVIADCGRVCADGPAHDLVACAAALVLVVRPALPEVVRLRERAGALRGSLSARGCPRIPVLVLVVAARRRFHTDLGQVRGALGPDGLPVVGGLAFDPGAAASLRGDRGARLGRSLLIRSARDVAGRVATWPAAMPGGAQAAAAWADAARGAGPGR